MLQQEYKVGQRLVTMHMEIADTLEVKVGFNIPAYGVFKGVCVCVYLCVFVSH